MSPEQLPDRDEREHRGGALHRRGESGNGRIEPDSQDEQERFYKTEPAGIVHRS